MRAILLAVGLFAIAGVLPQAVGQWNPAAGQWGKSDPNDVRVMTWNIEDAVCRLANKTETDHAWHATARIVAAMRPDVLILQETGDNAGNASDGDGQSGDGDTVAELETTIGLFLHGGTDPFVGGTVAAFVQDYAPDFDLPYVWVSSLDDGYNRNVVLSRYPFADLNGDTVSQRPIPATVVAHLYAWGGNGGIRGFMFGELDLPDETYVGDLVIGNAHLKSGSTSQDLQERERAARNMAYYIDYLLNGGGTGTPDPFGKIMDSPAATTILPPDTPVIIGGDWNEDELNNGRKGPAEWLTMAEVTGGTDGTDRDRTDMTYDDARNPYNNQRGTRAGSKLDYLAWQDSIATLRRAFIFNTVGLPSGWYPPEIIGYSSPATMSDRASDHRPVIADFVLPLVPAWAVGDLDCDGAVGFSDINPFVLALSNPAAYAAAYPDCDLQNGDIDGDGVVGFGDINPFVALLSGGD